MNGKTRRNRAFTLIELLVVITIISMLMAMLLPAVNAAVEAARQITCRSNVRNLTTAVMNYETQNGYYPGYVNSLGDQTNAVSWIVAVFPQLDRLDLYERWTQDGDTPEDTNADSVFLQLRPKMELHICPSDPPPSNGIALNSYIINAGVPLTREQALVSASNKEAIAASGIAHNNFTSAEKVRTSADMRDGATYTLCISENVQSQSGMRTWDAADKQTNVMVWHAAGPGTTLGVRKINGLQGGGDSGADATTLSQVVVSENSARPASFHTEGVNVGFCDGHEQFLRFDIDYGVYIQLMTPGHAYSSIQTDTYDTTATPDWRTYILNGADYQ